LENLEQFGLLTSNPLNESDEAGEKEPDKKNKKPMAAAGRSKAGKEIPVKLDKKYYQANPNFVLFEEIKALIVKAQILYEKDFIKKLHNAGSPKLLIFAGYFVNNHESAIDLLIVGKFNKAKLVSFIRELENDLGREINYTIMDNREFKYRRDITDIFLYDILEGKKLIVINDLGV